MSTFIELVNSLRHRRLELFQLLAALLGALVAAGVTLYQQYEKKLVREQSLTYEKQMEVLNQVQSSIDNLKNFVIVQKKQLQDQETVLKDLKSEQDKLRPVVEADRQVVEALFRVQAERTSANVWAERLIGFSLGVVSSLVASLIWSALRLRRSNKALNTDAPDRRAG